MIGNKYFKLIMVNGSVITYNVLNTAESCSEWYPDKQQPSTAHHSTSLLVSSCSLRNEMALYPVDIHDGTVSSIHDDTVTIIIL